jgi:cytochrome c peroxidase
MNPLYKQLLTIRTKTGISIPPGQSAVNSNAGSIFQDNFFNVNFFSPPKEYWITDKRVELGKKLFSDPVLSGAKDRSCASCHSPEKAFTDGLRVPLSLDEKTPLSRNSPTLWNSALQTRQFFDTRTDILEGQLKEVVHNSAEMKGSLRESVAQLKKQPDYLEYFREAYSDEKEPISAFNIANAISSYIRSLTSFDSRFDQYMSGDKSKLSASEKKGFNLFTGKAKCATCHFVPLFNGLVPPEFSETETEVLGVPQSKDKTNAILDADLGKYDISKSIIHKHSFKTPTLRNIELTGPYMHNGVFDSLEEVMDFYNDGGGEGLKIAPENQTLPKEKLNLTKKEIVEIIAFMKSLTGHSARHYKN